MANQGVAPPDYTTAVGQTRLLIGDTDATDVDGDTGTYAFYSDTEIAALVSLHADDPRRAAAAMLRAIAITPSLKLKKWTSADLMIDGPAITEQLLAAAAALEDAIKAGMLAQANELWVSVPVGGRERRDDLYYGIYDAVQRADRRLVEDIEDGLIR